MDKQQALKLLAQAAAQYHGTLEEHQSLQQAIEVIQNEIYQTTEEDNEKKTKK